MDWFQSKMFQNENDISAAIGRDVKEVIAEKPAINASTLINIKPTRKQEEKRNNQKVIKER